MRRVVLWVGLVALVARCGDDGPATLLAIEPASGPNDRAVPVVIRGQALEAQVAVDVGCDGHAVANAGFQAALAQHLLQGVALQGRNLVATVPAGLPPGEYDLMVATPQGATLTLPHAYQVLGPGTGDGGMCDELYASSQQQMGQGNNGNLALGPPDGMAGTISGQWAANRSSWTFSFDPSGRTGAVTARVTLVLWTTGGYIDDRVLVEASGDGGQTWQVVQTYGVDSGLTLPTLRAEVGPFPAPNINHAPGLGQAQVRIRGNGAAGPRDSFMLHVDAVGLQLCP